MNTEDQLRQLLQKHGMNPEKIRYNEHQDYYQVSIGVEDTDDRFLEGVSEIGSEGAVDHTVDTTALRSIAGIIDGANIEEGTIDIMDMMKDSHFQIQIQ